MIRPVRVVILSLEAMEPDSGMHHAALSVLLDVAWITSAPFNSIGSGVRPPSGR